MNYFGFNPIHNMQAGMNMAMAMQENHRQAIEDDYRQKQRDALAGLAQQSLIPGFEDTPSAVMPSYLKSAYESGDPELAFKLNALAASPYAEQRAIRHAYELEAGKHRARQEGAKGTLADVLAMYQGLNRGTSPMLPARYMPATGVTTDQGQFSTDSLPGEGTVFAPEATPAGYGNSLAAPRAPGDVRSENALQLKTKYDPEKGLTFDFDQPSPFEQRLKAEDLLVKQRGNELTGETNARQLAADHGQRVQSAFQAVREEKSKLNELRQQQGKKGVHPGALQEAIAQQESVVKDAQSYLDSVSKGDFEPMGTPNQATLLPMERRMARTARENPPAPPVAAPPAQAAKAAPKTTAKPITQAAPVEPAPMQNNGMEWERKQEVSQKALEQEHTSVQKIIDSAHAAADSSANHKPATDRILKLLKSEDLGSRAYKIPGMTTVATMMSHNYDALNKWRNALVDMDIKEGQSQMYNTLPELKIHSEQLPSVDNDENTNREAMASTASILEARLQAPKFLEEWTKSHGGTLRGARELFREWMDVSPKYQAVTHNGVTKLEDNAQYVPLKDYVAMRRKYPPEQIDILMKRGLKFRE